MKQRLYAVGNLSGFTCYLDVSRGEAIRRFKKENKEYVEKYGFSRVIVKEIDFDEQFDAYDVWESE